MGSKLLKENVTKTYKKALEKLQKSISLEAKSIATNLKLSDWIKKLAEAPAYMTLKDHKENFWSKPSCRLINWSKIKIGKISKITLDKINKKLLKELDFNRWKKTDDFIHWFRNIPSKSEYRWTRVIWILKEIQNLFELHEFSNYRSSDYFDRILKKNKQEMFLHNLKYCAG